MITHRKLSVLSSVLGATLLTSPAFSQASYWPSTSAYGMPGLIDMPTAESLPDGQLVISSSRFAEQQKTALAFQISPRLTGAFRYSVLNRWASIAKPDVTHTADRSFDFQFRVFDEGQYTPSVAIGLRDFIGAGLLGAEYLVATKSVTPTVKVTGGLGWGRLSNTDTIRKSSVDQGGTPNYDQWFTGPVGFFGGVEWITPVENLTFKLEYSSDQYHRETDDRNVFDRKSSVNIAFEYTPIENLQLGLYYLYGSELGLSFSIAVDPKTTPFKNASFEGAPTPIAARPANYSTDTSWLNVEGINERGQDQLNQLLNPQGISVEALSLNGTQAELRFRNSRYNASAQAFGRAARAMAHVMPDSVNTFVLTPMENGLAAASLTVSRRDLEQLEHDIQGAELILERSTLSGAGPMPENAVTAQGLYPDFSYSFGPYLNLSLFDPAEPVRADVGLRASATYQASPGLSFSGSVRKKLTGNLNDAIESDSELPKVRSNSALYSSQGDPALEYLTGEYLFKAGRDLYGRVSAGYLEAMFGGVSTELIWKPAQQNWGLGVDLAYVKQRDFNMRLGFQDYSVLTGHLSTYFQIAKEYQGEVSVGRYLAGDWGSTFAVNRVFDNGWKIGAYATISETSFDNFGEGNFDKGIRMTIPMSWALGRPSKRDYALDLNSLARDGGAKLNNRTPLYPIIEDYHAPNLGNGQGRFWR